MSDTMPYGYRWIVKEDFDRSEYAKSLYRPFMGGTIVPWDCMVEFDFDHDHDSVECERMMALMNEPDVYDDTDPYADDAHYERFGRPAFPNEY